MLTETFDASLTSTSPNSNSSTTSSVSGLSASLDVSNASLLLEFQARTPVINENPIKSKLGIPGTKPKASITSDVGNQAAERSTWRLI